MIHRHLLSTLIPVVVLTLLTPLGSAAKEEWTMEQISGLSMDDLMQIVVVTSAAKQEQNIREAPASVFVITQEDIQRFGYRTLGEALRRIAGIYVSSDRNYEYMGIRGFSRPGDYNTRVLILIDDHRLNDPLYHYAPIGEDLPIDLGSVERIEVVKGPGSALWGGNALAAVINIVTRKGAHIDGGRVRGEYGTHNRGKGFVEYGRRLDNGLEFAGSIAGLSSDGQNRIHFKQSEFKDPTDPDSRNMTVTGLDDEEAERGYFTASFKGLSLLVDHSRRRKEIPTGPFGTILGQTGAFTVDERTFVDLSYKTEPLSKTDGQIRLRGFYDEDEYFGDYPYPGAVGAPPTINKDSGNSEWWGGEISYARELLSWLSVITGFEYIRANDIRQKNMDRNPYFSYVHTRSPLNLRSGYVQSDVAIRDDLTLVLGIRLDDDSMSDRVWSPRGAVLYSPFSRTTLKFLYGEAFRGPNDWERTYDDKGLSQAGNPDLNPEEMETLEFVWEQQIGEPFRLTASVFSFELADIITQIQRPDGLLQFRNVGTVRSKGMELQLESRHRGGLTSYVGLTGLDTEEAKTGRAISNSPEFLAVGGISVPLLPQRLFLTPEVQYTGSRRTMPIPARPSREIGSSVVANLTLSSGPIFAPFEFSLSAYNLFDERHFVPGSGEHRQDRLPQDGRTYRFSLAYRF